MPPQTSNRRLSRRVQPTLEMMESRHLLTASIGLLHQAAATVMVASDPVARSANLSTTLVFAPGRKVAYEGVAAILTITNNGPLDATDLEVFVPLLAGGDILAVSGYTYAFGDQGATIPIGSLAAGTSEQVPLVLRLSNSSTVTLTAIVTGPTADTSAASATTAIQGRSLFFEYGPRVLSSERMSVHRQPTSVVLTFDTAMDPARAVNLANYSLRPVGFRGRLGRPLKLKSTTYDPETFQVQLTPRGRLNPRVAYQLVAVGSVSTGLTDATGILLDGKNFGLSGDDYVTTLPRLT